MKRNGLQLLLITLVFTGTTAMLAQRPGPGPRRYDVKTEITVKGTVDDVQQFTGRRGMDGTHLMLKTDTETLDVHVGPTSFLADKKFSVAKGDQVEVTGSKVKVGGADVLLAREITKDGSTVVLRDSQGRPQWSGPCCKAN